MASADTPPSDTDDVESTAPESTLSLKRLPMYYDFDQLPWDGKQGQSWMYAREVQEQQAGLPLPRVPSAVHGVTTGWPACVYPSYFGNREKLPLSTKSEHIYNPTKGISTKGWLHHPLIPGRTATFCGSKHDAGIVRSFYAPSDPSVFDVGYHQDHGKPKYGKVKNGKFKKQRSKNKKSKNKKFKLATYHPAVEEADDTKVVAEYSNEN